MAHSCQSQKEQDRNRKNCQHFTSFDHKPDHSTFAELSVDQNPSIFSNDQSISPRLSSNVDSNKTEIYTDLCPSLRGELNVIKRFTPTGGPVLSLSAVNDNLCWVGKYPKLLLLINQNVNCKTQLSTVLPGDPLFTHATSCGDVIVSTIGHVIYHVTKEGRISHFKDVSPNIAYGITVTHEDEVFACIKMEVDVGRCKHKVVKFSAQGQTIFQVNCNLIPTSDPIYVHTVTPCVICIQDGQPQEDEDSKLVFVDQKGKLISRIRRAENLLHNTKTMVWDIHANMISGEFDNEIIHVFDMEGKLKQSYPVPGSVSIMGLSLGQHNTLWIGTMSGEVIVAKYIN